MGRAVCSANNRLPSTKLLLLKSRLKLQIFEKLVPKNVTTRIPITHMPRNDGETSLQTVSMGKRESTRHFFSKLLDQIRKEARNKEKCRDRYGEKLGNDLIY